MSPLRRRSDTVADAGGPVAMFPGQGSQHTGMAVDLCRAYPAVRELVEHASELSGLPLRELMRSGPRERLAMPDAAQLSVVAVSLGLVEHLRAAGLRVAAVMGHSAGEFTALAAAGVLDTATALWLVTERGRAMAEAARRAPGAMAAIAGLRAGEVHELCAEAQGAAAHVTVAGYNSPVQVVVSGDAAAVDAVERAARRRGALRVDRLPVGGAFHSPLMEWARQHMHGLLADVHLRPPRCPMVSSVTGEMVDDLERYRAALLQQMTRPVRWTDAVACAAGLGTGHFLEVGPGRVLSALVRVCDRSVAVTSVRDVPGCEAFLAWRDAALAVPVTA